MKTAELKDAALDWAVAKCEGWSDEGLEDIAKGDKFPEHDFSTNWAQGGPIIEREKIDLLASIDGGEWTAEIWSYSYNGGGANSLTKYGPTPLIAAMRCYVASKLGEEVDVPEELVNTPTRSPETQAAIDIAKELRDAQFGY